MSKKEQYWNHFCENKQFHGAGFTPKRLEKIKPIIFEDVHFWNDVLYRHGGKWMSPDELKEAHEHTYNHCMGNMMGMIMQSFVEHKIIKA